MNKNKGILISAAFALIITVAIQFVFIAQKQGWHEDEIFSYGSANYAGGNMFLNYGESDPFDEAVAEMTEGLGFFSKVKAIFHYYGVYYYGNEDEAFLALINEKEASCKPIWKTPEDAEKYITATEKGLSGFGNAVYNQARDVHPPLFYIAVHAVSLLYFGRFSKYIIFFINLIFHIGICIFITKILYLIGRQEYCAAAIILYGASIGEISAVMFQRMYVMLAFFTVLYFYIILKIRRNGYIIGRKSFILLFITTVCGFLTHYYFCLYAIAFFAATVFFARKNAGNKEALKFTAAHIAAGATGIFLFPAAVFHIFKSYRGFGGGTVKADIFERLKEYFSLLFYSFGLKGIFGILCIASVIPFILIKIRSKEKDLCIILVFTETACFIFTALFSPFENIRYIIPVLPFAAITATIILSLIINNLRFKKKSTLILAFAFICVHSFYGVFTVEPEFLYRSDEEKISMAEELSDRRLVYAVDGDFIYISDIEEFLRYKSTLIIRTRDGFDVLNGNEGLSGEKDFVLEIRKDSGDSEKALSEVVAQTNATGYTLLLDCERSVIYIIYL